MVLDRCTKYIETDGSAADLDNAKRQELSEAISNMADKGLRTLCLSYRQYEAPSDSKLPEESPDEDLIACCIVGIKVWSHDHFFFFFSQLPCQKCTCSVYCRHNSSLAQCTVDMESGVNLGVQ